MNSLVKTAEQIEIAEIFERLETEFGMTKADVARELKMTRSYVGYLVDGRRKPAPRTLDDFRRLEEKMKAAKAHGQKIEKDLGELEQIYSRIALMEKNDRPNFEVVKKVVESLTPVSSKTTAAGARLLKKNAASVRKPVQE